MKTPEPKTRNKTGRICLILAVAVCYLQACYIDGTLPECEGSRIEYRFIYDGTGANVIRGYLQSVEEYIYDSDGNLLSASTVDMNATRRELEPGTYTLVAWGNRTIRSRIENGALQEKEDSEPLPDPMDRLYFGFRTFQVSPKGASRVTVDMVHAHAVLDLTVRWKRNPPPNTGDFYLLLREVPSGAEFTPSHLLRERRWQRYEPQQEAFPTVSTEQLFYVPGVKETAANSSYRRDAVMNVDRQVKATFVTFRYGNRSPLILTLHAGEKQLTKEISLERFFREMGIELEMNMRQEFSLELAIDGDRIEVSLSNTNDWGEGGEVN